MIKIPSFLRFSKDIFIGSNRLILNFPILVFPFFLVCLVTAGLVFRYFGDPDRSLGWLYFFLVGFTVLYSFMISSNLLLQIQEGEEPSLFETIRSPKTLSMLPIVIFLSATWFMIFLIIVFIEMFLDILLLILTYSPFFNTHLDEPASKMTNFFFGRNARVIRMLGFMLIPIILNEEVGLSKGYARLKFVLRSSNPITLFTGLKLTKTAIMFIVIPLLIQFWEMISIELSTFNYVMMWIVIVFGWTLAMYLEQLFVMGLYLYTIQPDSRVVDILLGEHLGRELPIVPPSYKSRNYFSPKRNEGSGIRD